MPMKLTFLGATGTVTGSKYLVQRGTTRLLIDCGLFQGLKQLRLKNREPLSVDPSSLHAVVLTHAHLDHSGYIPLLIKNGFKGKVYCTEATRELCEILLPDSGHLQEEEANFANKHGFSKHHPALPLYTREEAERSLSSFVTKNYRESFNLSGLKVTLAPSGHILGSSFVTVKDETISVVFSGDLGRPNDPVMQAPSLVKNADYLVVESTYGDRVHHPGAPEDQLEEVINRTVKRGGVVLIPAFAVGRSQELLYFINLLKKQKRIPNIPVYLDSPMARSATHIFCAHPEEHRLSNQEVSDMCNHAVMLNTPEQSMQIDRASEPMILISASGMATGGRVLHHIKVFGPHEKNTLLFSGFQAAGTRGASIVAGAESVKIHGDYVPIRCEVLAMNNLSAHADSVEILEWLGQFERPPRQTFITHGEPIAAEAMKKKIEEKLRWSCRVPKHLDSVELS